MALTTLLANTPIALQLVILTICALVAYLTFSKSPANPTTESIKPQIPLDPSKPPDAPVSVNYFPSRKCNYTCGFCFHT